MTIEENAAEYRGRFLAKLNETRTALGKSSLPPDNEIVDLCLDTAEQSYRDAAYEQRKIDVHKVCEWLLNNESTIYWAIESPNCKPSLKNVVEQLRIYLED